MDDLPPELFEPVEEYILGLDRCPMSLFDSSKNWRYQFGGMCRAKIQEKLPSIFRFEGNETLSKICRFISTMAPYSIVTHVGETWLKLISKSQRTYYVNCSPLDDCFDRDFDHNSFEFQFLKKFSGLRTELPTHAGSFLGEYNADFGFMVEGYDICTTKIFQSWKTARPYYHAANGDLLLCRKDGNLAWHVFAENRIEELPASAEMVIPKLFEIYENGRIIDSYSYAEAMEK